MRHERLALPEVVLIAPDRHHDARGFFSETWQAARFAALGIEGPFVQDNHSLSRRRGTVRGLHLQVAPHPQGKLVRCVRGAIWDVAVDVRRDSPTRGRHVAALLSAENWNQLWIPAGFAHGFSTLEDDTEVVYKVTGDYARACERGVAWDDPDLGIDWRLPPGGALVSDKDRALPRLRDCPAWFGAAGGAP